ncbi:MAG: hypothetical protein NVS3B25_07190 [Hymenobacter sp.]
MGTRKDALSYTPAEDKALRRLYPRASHARVLAAVQPGRKWVNLANRAHKLGVKRTIHPIIARAWTADETATLLAHSRTIRPGKLVALLPGRTSSAIGRQAAKLGVAYVPGPPQPRSRAFIGPRELKPKKAPKPQVAKAPKPVVVKPPKPAAPVRPAPVKRSPGTPNLNVQKAVMEKKKKVEVSITAEEVRKLPYHHEGRKAYMLHGRAGWENYQKQKLAYS